MGKDVFGSITLLDAGDMSEAELVSDALPLYERTQYALQAVYTGSPDGAMIVEVSVNGDDYETLTSSSVAISGAGSYIYNVTAAGYLWARIKYTKTSGTGELTVVGSAKE
jgi:hypothetical protein